MPVSAGISAAAALGTAGIGYLSSKNASNAQTQLGQQALQTQTQLGQQGLQTLLSMFDQAKGIVQPVIDTGKGILDMAPGFFSQGGDIINQGRGILGSGTGAASSALGTLQSLLTPGANMTATLSQIPGFQFAQDWGQKAVQNIGTTQGLGGNTLKAGADYATGAAQQGFGSIVNALQGLLGGATNLGNVGNATIAGGTGVLNTGAGILGTGAQTMAGPASSLASGAINTGNSAFGNLNQLGSTIGGTLGGIGNAQAAGILGQGNALSGGLTGTGNSITNSLLLSKLLGNNGYSPDLGQGIYKNGVQTGIMGIGPVEGG